MLTMNSMGSMVSHTDRAALVPRETNRYAVKCPSASVTAETTV